MKTYCREGLFVHQHLRGRGRFSCWLCVARPKTPVTGCRTVLMCADNCVGCVPLRHHACVASLQVWGVPPSQMQCRWLGERVATVDINRAVSNIIHGREDAGWGPNAVFRFPKHGGTGAIWKAVAQLLPADKQVCVGAEG